MSIHNGRPVIFLDIDGVLNRNHPGSPTGPWFVPECVAAMRWAIEKTNAAVVVSSAWRYLMIDTDGILASMTVPGFEYLLRTHGLSGNWDAPLIVDVTPSDEEIPNRAIQIQAWIDRYKPERYVAVDDMDLGEDLHDFIKTDGSVGFTIDDAIRVVRWLGVEV